MIEIVESITVDLPPGEAFAYWSDHSNNPEWQDGQKRCTWTSEPPIGVGSTYDQEAGLAGRPIISSFECVEFEPGTRIRMVTTKSTIPLDITREVASAPDGRSVLTATIRGGATGWVRFLDPLTRRIVAANVRKDYARLKELLDTGSRP